LRRRERYNRWNTTHDPPIERERERERQRTERDTYNVSELKRDT